MHTSAGNAVSAWLVLATDACDRSASEATGLPVRGLAALVLVRNRPAANVDWLHRRLAITHSGAVRLVDRLEASGLLRRAKSPGRREVALYVTEEGEALLRHGLAVRARAIEALLEPLSPDDRSRLAALMAKALAGGTRRRGEADVACRLCDWDLCKPQCPVDASVIEGVSAR